MEYKHLPDLKGLASLKAVRELGGVEQAARALFVGQPAITKRLRALEDCYGLPLLHRKGRRLELTEAGERVYAFARLVLDRHGMVMDDLALIGAGQDKLRLEVNSAIGEHLLPDLLLRFADVYPEYRIESRMEYTRRIQEHLVNGLADLALMEQAPDHPDILAQKWLDDEILLVCGPNHVLADTEMIPVTELLQFKYVLREHKAASRLLLDKALNDVGVQGLPVAMEVGSTDTIVEMLERGRHLSFLPLFAVAEQLVEGRLRHIKIQGLRIKRTLWIARTHANLRNAAAEAFVQTLRGETRRVGGLPKDSF